MDVPNGDVRPYLVTDESPWNHLEIISKSKMDNEVFDVLVIGSGAIGCAVAREMALLGQKCIILEKNMDIISEASSGNTGHLVTF